MIAPQNLFFTSTGRIGRHSYWTLIATLFLAGSVLSLVPSFGAVLPIPVLWPVCCVVAKRLHDGGRGAWPVLAVGFLAILAAATSFGAALLATQPESGVVAFALAWPAFFLDGASVVASLSLIVFAGCARKDESANRFGDPEHEPVTILALFYP